MTYSALHAKSIGLSSAGLDLKVCKKLFNHIRPIIDPEMRFKIGEIISRASDPIKKTGSHVESL
jgi:hypothetical protein